MKRLISIFRLALMAIAFSPFAGSLHAQTPKILKVRATFALPNGSQTRPTGVYGVTRLNCHLYSIGGAGNSSLTLGQNSDSDSRTRTSSTLVFRRYGSIRRDPRPQSSTSRACASELPRLDREDPAGQRRPVTSESLAPAARGGAGWLIFFGQIWQIAHLGSG